MIHLHSNLVDMLKQTDKEYKEKHMSDASTQWEDDEQDSDY